MSWTGPRRRSGRWRSLAPAATLAAAFLVAALQLGACKHAGPPPPPPATGPEALSADDQGDVFPGKPVVRLCKKDWSHERCWSGGKRTANSPNALGGTKCANLLTIFLGSAPNMGGFCKARRRQKSDAVGI